MCLHVRTVYIVMAEQQNLYYAIFGCVCGYSYFDHIKGFCALVGGVCAHISVGRWELVLVEMHGRPEYVTTIKTYCIVGNFLE